MHGECQRFTHYMKTHFPMYFENFRFVLDVGGADINGNNAYLFNKCIYISNDVVPSPNVLLACETEKLPFSDASFDTIISTECFEHDMNYKKSLRKIMKLLKPGGMFVFTCATTGRAEHGTMRTTPYDSMTTQYTDVPEWANYYKNLTQEDILECFEDDEFSSYCFYTNTKSCDLYFWGIKKSSSSFSTEKNSDDKEDYEDDGVIKGLYKE